jgi:hypothetical protein
MNPITTIFEWFSKLPIEIRVEIAFFVLTLLPDYQPKKIADTEHLIANFNKWLLKDTDSKLRTIGKTLMIRAFINYTILTKRFEKKDLESTQELWRVVKRETVGDDLMDIIEQMEKNHLQKPLRKRIWHHTLNEWISLCEGPLSDEYIEKWQQSG